MGSVSSEEGVDDQSDRCGSYSLSADVSESESCSSFSCRRYDGEGASSSMTSSPLACRPVLGNSSFPMGPPLMLPVIGGRDVVVWGEKPEKRETDLSGSFCFFNFVGFTSEIVVFYVCLDHEKIKDMEKKFKVNPVLCNDLSLEFSFFSFPSFFFFLWRS